MEGIKCWLNTEVDLTLLQYAFYRRRIIVILRQIVKTTFGDTINRKIVESVEERTSSDQIAEYVKTLKNALWPNGIPAEQGRERDPETKSRTRVAAKMLLLCSVTGG